MSCRSALDDACASESETIGGMRMTLSVSGSKAARELLFCLGETPGLSFTVDCVIDAGSAPCVLTVDHLSEQQLETAAIAVENGYYETPRAVSLSELTEEFDVSNSAVSQRLSNVERTLVRSLIETYQL